MTETNKEELKNEVYILLVENLMKGNISKEVFELIFSDTYLSVISKIKEEKVDALISHLSKNIKKRKNSWYRSELSPAGKITELVEKSYTINDNVKESYRNDLMLDIFNWKKSEALMTAYPYLKFKATKSKKTALIMDIEMFLLNHFKSSENLIASDTDKNNSNNNNDIKPHKSIEFSINKLVTVPYDTVGREVLKKDGDKLSMEYNSFSYSILVKDIESAQLKDNLSQLAVKEISKTLNKTDIAVFNYLIKFGMANLLRDESVIVPIKDLVHYVFKSYSGKSKDTIIASIVKLSNMKVNFITSNKEGAYLGLLSNYSLTIDEKSKLLYVEAFIDPLYKRECLKGYVTKIYSSTAEKCSENEDAKRLLFILQRERMSFYYASQNKENGIPIVTIDGVKCYYKEVDYSYFESFIIFRTKSSLKRKQRIDKALDLIANGGDILFAYTRTRDDYHLYFPCVTEEEINNLEHGFANVLKVQTKDILLDTQK